MKKLTLICGLMVMLQVTTVYAQLAPGNDLGVRIGHVHVFPADRDKEARALQALGGQLEYNLSNNIPIGFPGIIFLIGNARPGNQSSEGSVIDHLTFRVPDLKASMVKWNGIQAWWKNGTWFAKVEQGSKPGQAFVTTPGGMKFEIIEDKSLKIPIVFDAVHYYIDEPRLKPMEDYYVKMFGAKPVKGKQDTFDISGGKLIFTKTDAPPLPTTGRTLDHVGFDMKDAETLNAFAKRLAELGANMPRPYAPSSMGMIRLATDFGTNIEVTKAQAAYFDPQLLDKGYYTFDEGGKKEGEKPTYAR